MTRFRRGAVTALVIYVILCTLAGIFLADATLHPQRRPLDALAINQADEVARSAHSSLVDVAIETGDRISLNAWLIHPAAANGDAVILLHGLADNRIGMIGYAELLLESGYTVLMPDARAHGQSGGPLATFGLLERGDVQQWARWLKSNQHPGCIFGLGESMGAAQLLQSVEGNSLFCAVAAESSFSSFREIGYDRVGQYFQVGAWLGRFPLRPIIESAFLYSRLKYRLDLQNVSPEKAVMAIKIPVLLIHGQIDSNIPIRHSRRIKSLAPKVSLWEIPGAEHCGALSTDHEEFRRRVLDWYTAHATKSMSAFVPSI